jgi:ABC-2 type transport system permease protein
LRALIIAWKDVRHTYRNIAALAMMLAAPMLLASALGMAFGSGDDYSIQAVKTVVVDLDMDPDDTTTGGDVGGEAPAAMRVGAQIVAALTNSELADILIVTQAAGETEAREAVDGDEADVAVIIPAGATEALLGDGLSGATDAAAVIRIYKDPAATVGPSIVAAVVRSVTLSLEGARAAAVTAAGLAASQGLTDAETLRRLATVTAASYGAAAEGAAPLQLDARAPVMSGDDAAPNVASQVLVGMMIFFMLFGASTPARSIIDEQREGTLSRLFTTPTPRSVILGGKYVAVFLVVLLQSVILLLAGWLLLGARWGEAGPVAVLTLTGALVAASLGLLTVSFAKTPGQAGAVSSAIFVFLALIGGNFVGSTNVGGAFALVRRFTPNGWLIEGWDSLLYGGSWMDILYPVAAALGFSVVFFALATWFFSRRFA